MKRNALTKLLRLHFATLGSCAAVVPKLVRNCRALGVVALGSAILSCSAQSGFAGTVRFNVSGTDAAYGVALQSDGKIVAVGDAGGDFAVARLTTAGTLDPTFSPGGLDGDGIYRFNISGTDAARAVALQPDGKIVVVGKSGDDFAVARLTSAGVLDPTFSPGGLDGDGIYRFNISGTDAAYGVVIQPDGKIVVVGDAGGDFAVARLTSAGALDSSFSPGGLDGNGIYRFNISGTDAARAVALQSDGKIVIVGRAGDDFAVARLTSAGALDTSFSPGGLDGDGIYRFNVSGTDAAYGLAIQPDGKIVVVGDAGGDFAAARLTAAGALDSTFSPGGLDGNGIYRFNVSGTDAAYGVKLQSDGKIVIVGDAGGDFAVARLTAAGALDSSFSPGGLDGNGIYRFNISGTDAAYGVVLQPDGKIVVAGDAGGDFAVSRLTSTGAADSTFPGPAPSLTISDAAQNFIAAGGGNSFTVSANVAWTWSLTSGSGWVTSGEATSQSGDQTFTYSVAGNTSVTSPTATVTFTAGALLAIHTISQNGVTPTLSVSDTSENFTADGGEFGIAINSNTTWTWSLAAGTGWVASSEAQTQSGTQAFMYSVATNLSLASRSATITFTSGPLTSAHTISQNGATPKLTVSSPTGSIGAAGGSSSFTVNANTTWTWSLSAGSSWVTSSEATSQTGDQVFTCTAAPNNGVTSRTATVTFTSGALVAAHSITQSGAAPTLSVSDSSHSFSAGGGSYSFSVNANSTWSWIVSGGSGWFTSDESTAQSGSQTFTYTVSPNPLTNAQSATITFTNGTLAATHTILVQGQPNPQAAPSLSVSRNGPGFLAVAWPAGSSGYVLQINDSLAPSGWVNAPAGISNPATFPTTGSAKYFRLRKP